MGSRRDCTWILGLSRFRVVTMEEIADRRLTIRIERRGVRRYACNGCGDGRVVCDRVEIEPGMTCPGRRTTSHSCMRSDGSSVGRAGFAPSAWSSPIRRPASPAGCDSR